MNGTVKDFDKIMEKALTKVCNVHRDDCDQKVSVVLWAYHTNYKRLTCHTPFILVYGKEVIVPMEHIVLSLRIAALIEITDGDVEQRLSQLVQMEEDHFVA